MKQLLFIIMLLSGCLCSYAQSGRYSAFSVTGKVQVKQDAEWKDVTKRMPLGAFDELRIPEKASVKILETKTNAIYKSNGSGNMTVRQLVKNAKAQSESTLSGLTQAFTKGMRTQVDNTNRLRSVGAAHRGSSSDATFEDSICSTIAYSANLLLEQKEIVQDTVVVGNKVIEQDIYTISLENKTELAYCVNIVSINKANKTCRLLLSPGYEENLPYIILDAHAKANLDNITYLNNSDEILFVFASDRLFDNEEVKAMLEDYQLNEGKELYKMQYSEIR